MYLVKTPGWLKKIYAPGLIWSIPGQNEIYLTFDDGPHPTATPFVLNCLRQFGAKATFFCIGKNVEQHLDIYKDIIEQGHSVANHTHNHVNGWKTAAEDYLENVNKAKQCIASPLFRPPYGRLTRLQAKLLKPHFKIIMWDVLSGDFDIAISPQQCFKNATAHTKAGSIIVFHDSEKAFPRLEYALPKALQFFAEKEFVMKALGM